MKSMLISTFKAKCISEIKEVNSSRQPLTITLRGKPIAQVVPLSKDSESPKRVLGFFRGSVIEHQDWIKSSIESEMKSDL
jgi:prevent-host-death family protein